MLRLDDDDDDFNVPQPSSRLATLFSHDNQAVTDDSFKYKAPKDPSQKLLNSVDGTKKDKAPPKTTLLCAYSGHCFKLVNGQYSESQKLGVAIIGEVHNNLFSILLYITKDKPISFTRIINSTIIEVGNRNFVSFKDDSNDFWSVSFTCEEEVVGFNKQVALARWMSGDGTKLMMQDLQAGEGCLIDPGDLVEVKVSRFRLVTEGVLILDPVGEELVKFKVGKMSIPQEWEDCVVGMKKMGRRLIMYSKEELSESGDKLSEIVVEEITVVRVKFAKGKEPPKNGDKSPVESSAVVVNESSPRSVATSSHRAEEKHNESKSTRTNQEKAVLLDRIKKLGQPMLPVTKVTSYTDDLEEGDKSGWSSRSNSRPSPELVEDREGEVVISQMLIKPDVRPKPAQVTRVLHDNRPVQDYQLQRPSPSFTTFSPFMTGQTIPHSQSPDPGMSLMMLDMKQQNLDLRSLLMRTIDKIEALGSKVDDIQKTSNNLSQQHQQQQQQQQHQQQQQQQLLMAPSSSSSFSSPLLQCEVNAIAQSIDKIFKDNEALRREVKDKDARIGNLTQKMNEVYDNNQRLIQNQNESTNSIVNNKILAEENAALKLSVEETKNQLSQLQSELTSTKEHLTTRSSEVVEARLRLDEMQVKMSTMKDEMKAKTSNERSEFEEEIERLKRSMDECNDRLEMERQKREERDAELLEKRTKLIECDRIISDLRETLMRKNDADSKVAIKEMESDFMDRLTTREEYHTMLARSWEDERINLINKLSESEKLHHLKMNEVVKQKNGQIQAIKEDMMKLSQEYNIIKILAKDLKEKYNLSLEQHSDHLEQNTAKIKGLMNSIYRGIREEFMAEKSYSGTSILMNASKIIKSKTLEMMGNNNANQNNITMKSSPSSSSLNSLVEDLQLKSSIQLPPVSSSSSPPPVKVSSPSSPPVTVSLPSPPPVVQSSSSVTSSLLSNSTLALSLVEDDDRRFNVGDGESFPDETRSKDKDEKPIIGAEKQVTNTIGQEECGAEKPNVETSHVPCVREITSHVKPEISPDDTSQFDEDSNLKVEGHLGEATHSNDPITNLPTHEGSNINKEHPIGSEIDSVLTNERKVNEQLGVSLDGDVHRSATNQDSNDDSPIKPPPFPDSDDDWDM